MHEKACARFPPNWNCRYVLTSRTITQLIIGGFLWLTSEISRACRPFPNLISHKGERRRGGRGVATESSVTCILLRNTTVQRRKQKKNRMCLLNVSFLGPERNLNNLKSTEALYPASRYFYEAMCLKEGAPMFFLYVGK